MLLLLAGFGSGPPANFSNSTAPGSDADFDQVFGNTSTVNSASVDLLTPTVADNAYSSLVTQQQTVDDSAQGSGDLHTTLARVAKSLGR